MREYTDKNNLQGKEFSIEFLSNQCNIFYSMLVLHNILECDIQSTPDNLNLQGKLKKVRVIKGKIIWKMT